MSNKFIDLHMHSHFSDDGEFSPADLVKRCHDRGISIMAITDHNSVKAVEEARKVADKYNIHYINGIELDCTYEDLNLHVIGYGIDYINQVFSDLEENILSQEKACSEQKLKLTNKLGFEINKKQLDDLSKNGVYTGEIFAEVLLNDLRYKEHKLLEPYRAFGNRSDNPYVNFYWDYYAKGKPCYTKIIYPSLKETISLITENGGVPVLAHPGNNLKGKFEIFDEIVDVGIQGVEAFSSYHDDETANYFLDKGREQGLLVTCGSDFHGKTKPAIEIGTMNCMVDEMEIKEGLEKRRLL